HFAEQWARTTGCHARKSLAMRVFQLDAVAPPVGVPGTLRWATTADRALVMSWVPGFLHDLGEPNDPAAPTRIANGRLREREPDPRTDPTGLALREDGKAVS